MEVVDRCGEECQVEGKTDELREPGAESADAFLRSVLRISRENFEKLYGGR